MDTNQKYHPPPKKIIQHLPFKENKFTTPLPPQKKPSILSKINTPPTPKKINLPNLYDLMKTIHVL